MHSQLIMELSSIIFSHVDYCQLPCISVSQHVTQTTVLISSKG